jgi:hypothetical protein
MQFDLEQIVQLAQLVEHDDPIDWTGIDMDREAAYRLVAHQLYEMQTVWTENRETILMASLVKVIVENFILNLRLESY